MIRTCIVIILLTIVTAAAYWQVRNHDFVYYDDQEYVIENRHVQDGLTMKGIRWAFTSTYAANWHPLTWLSHMTDRQFFGPPPAGPHLVNLFLHILNAVLLMVLLHRMTGGFWQSAFVAALFALHPLHVESVAWVAERKDVLSALFFMLTLLSYVRFVERPKPSRYLAALLCFLLGLMAKPMLVTLPFVLLLMDFWPLKRFDRSSFMRDAKPSIPVQPLRRLVLEKAPFLVLTILSSIVTMIAQRDAMPSTDLFPMFVRIGNAIVAYAGYLMKMIWPADLAVLYPLTLEYDPWKIAGAAALLTTITVLAVKVSWKRPYILVGWLWYVGTLVPVIGIIQVGQQSMADRYTYLPLIGIFIMAAWGLSEVVSRWPRVRSIATIAAITALVVLSGVTFAQAGYWKDSLTLFSRCASVTKNNYVALSQLGYFMVKQDRAAEALPILEQASALNSNDAVTQHSLGFALSKLGRDAEAAAYIQNAIRLKPNNARAYFDLGILIARNNDPASAAKQFQEALRIEPDNPEFRFELGVVLVDAGQLDQGIEQYDAVLKEKPSYVDAHVNIGVALARQGKMTEAIKRFSRALELNPADEHAQRYLQLARSRLNAADQSAIH